MREFAKRIYLNEKANASFVIVVLLNIILCILSYFVKLQAYVGIVGSIITIASFFGVSFGISIYNGQQEIRSANTRKESIPKEVSIQRSSWFDEILGKDGIVLLTGVSGIGKTYLLDQLMEHLTIKHISYFFENSNYFWNLDQNRISDEEYVILDQFERALAFDNIDENISILRSLKDKKLIISVRKEYLGEIYKLLDFDKSIHTVWLDYSKKEIQEIKAFLQTISRKTHGNIDKNSLYSQMLRDIEQGKLSMIQLSFLVREIQYKEEEYLKKKSKKYMRTELIEQENKHIKIYNYDDIIIDFCQEQLDAYKNSETAYMILFLLCLDHKGQYMNTIKDFQNISIQPVGNISEVLEFLLEQKWIKKVKDNEGVRSAWTEPWEIAHDYLQENFVRLCNEKIPSNIRNNIEYYNKNCQLQRESEEQDDCWRAYTNEVCQRFLKSENKRYTNIWLFIVASYLIGICGYLLNGYQAEGNDICFILIALNINVGMSIYYMYNYYYYFLTIFHWRYSRL